MVKSKRTAYFSVMVIASLHIATLFAADNAHNVTNQEVTMHHLTEK